MDDPINKRWGPPRMMAFQCVWWHVGVAVVLKVAGLRLLLVRGVDSELGEGEEAGPFGEADTDCVGVGRGEAMDLDTALGRGDSAEESVPGAFVEIFNDIFLHHAGGRFGHHDAAD